MGQKIKEIVDKVPAEMRWNIATLASTGTATALDAAIQAVVGPEKRTEILTQVYAASAPGLKQVIDSLEMPVDNAEAAAKAVTAADTILFGPEIQIEFTEANPKKVIGKVMGCPWPMRQKEQGTKLDCYPVCAAFHEAAYKAVNPNLEFKMGDNCLNRGDSYCGDFSVEMQE